MGGSEPERVEIAAESNERISAEMEVTLIRQGDEATLHVVKLPDLPPDQGYQAWIERDGELEPSSTFDVRKDGDVVIEGSLEGADGVHITREPEDGSEQPTSKLFMSVPL